MPFDATGIIGGIAGIGQSLIDARTAKKNTERTITANKQLAEYQYSKDLEMWNRANQYNDPSQQMARLKNAGLNPNMAYGSGSVAGNTTQATMPKYNAPRIDYNYKPPVDVANTLMMYNDFRMKNAQIDYIKEQERNARARTQNTEYKNELERMRSKQALWRTSAELQTMENKGYKTYLEAMQRQWETLGSRVDTMPEGAPFIKKYQNSMDMIDYKNQLLAKDIEHYWMKNLGNNLLGTGAKLLGSLGKFIGQNWKGAEKVIPGAKGISNKFPKRYGNYPGAGMR